MTSVAKEAFGTQYKILLYYIASAFPMGRAGKERSIEPCPKILNYRKQYFLERPYIYTNHQKVISFLQLFSAYVPAFGLWMQFPWHRIEVSCGLRRPKKSTHTQRSKEGDTIRMARRRENGSSGRVQVVSLRVPFSLAVCMPRKMREKGTLRSLSPLSIFLLPFRFAVPRAHQFLPCPPPHLLSACLFRLCVHVPTNTLSAAPYFPFFY